MGNGAYRDLSHSTLTDTGVGEDLALFLGFELLDSIELPPAWALYTLPYVPLEMKTMMWYFDFTEVRALSFRAR